MLLEYAAWGRCHNNNKHVTDASLHRQERKLKDKQKKALNSIEELLNRKSGQMCAYSDIYEPFAVILEERATMRVKWSERENDCVFKKISEDYKPIPFPAEYSSNKLLHTSTGRKNFGVSSMVGGDPKDLRRIAKVLRALGKAYLTRKISDLPEMFFHPCSSLEIGSDSCHDMEYDWIGWKNLRFALEMQSPWAKLLLDKKKTIETRAYDLPSDLLGSKIDILQSKAGSTGVSSLPNVIETNASIDEVVERIGWFTVIQVITYNSKENFHNDEARHLVSKESGYGWKDGHLLYGWVVGECGYYANEQQDMRRIKRRFRSLFEIDIAESIDTNYRANELSQMNEKKHHKKGHNGGNNNGRKRKKKRY